MAIQWQQLTTLSSHNLRLGLNHARVDSGRVLFSFHIGAPDPENNDNIKRYRIFGPDSVQEIRNSLYALADGVVEEVERYMEHAKQQDELEAQKREEEKKRRQELQKEKPQRYDRPGMGLGRFSRPDAEKPKKVANKEKKRAKSREIRDSMRGKGK